MILSGQTFNARRVADGLELNELRIPFLGRHQIINAGVAVAMLAELNQIGVEITDATLRAGLEAARWPGRFEILSKSPIVVVDSAHNADSARKLRRALTEWFPGPPRQRTALVFGASADKDIDGMLEAFLGPENDQLPVDKIIITRSGHPRAAATETLMEPVQGYGLSIPITAYNSMDEALADALAWAGPDDLICITGSIFVVAQARRAWAERYPDAFPPEDWVFQDESSVAIISDDEPESRADQRVRLVAWKEL